MTAAATPTPTPNPGPSAVTPDATAFAAAPTWLCGPGAIGGNLQTIWPALVSKRCDGDTPTYHRERWATPDADFIDVDWLAPRYRPGTATESAPVSKSAPIAATDTVPLLVLFHGLEGSSASHYARAFAQVAERLGWRYAVPHFRGCSGAANLTARAYHSGDFEEIGWILDRFRALHAGPCVAVGVSLGGNALLRWAEEAGSSAAACVSAVAALSSPVNLAASGHAIGRGFNRHVYTRMFLHTLRPKALAKLALQPNLFDRTKMLAARDLYDFDNLYTAPVHGFRDTDDYWLRGSALPQLHRIDIPALVVNALNDPFVPAASLPRADQVGRHVTLWQPAHGGHAGFPTGAFPGRLQALPERVIAWLRAHGGL
jgi:uncharacterized protein